MHKLLFLILLTAHFTADFYLRKDKTPDGTFKQVMGLILHCILYAVTGFLFCLLIWHNDLIVYVIIFGVSHFIIDLLKKLIKRKTKEKHTGAIYIIDQILHLATIFILSVLYQYNSGSAAIAPWLNAFMANFAFTATEMIKAALLLLIICKPANITFKKIFSAIKPSQDVKTMEKNIQVGAKIGSMERLLILVFLFVNEYGAIGLVLTGKSISRYKLISEEKDFAEYYLLGTFFSILATIVPFFIIWKLL